MTTSAATALSPCNSIVIASHRLINIVCAHMFALSYMLMHMAGAKRKQEAECTCSGQHFTHDQITHLGFQCCKLQVLRGLTAVV